LLLIVAVTVIDRCWFVPVLFLFLFALNKDSLVGSSVVSFWCDNGI